MTEKCLPICLSGTWTCCRLQLKVYPHFKKEVQLWPLAMVWLLNKPYVNEVYLTWQNPSLKFCWPLEIFTQFERGLDLSMLKIWSLYVKGLQSFQPSNFESDLTPVHLELGPTGSRVARAVWQTFSLDPQLWQVVTLRSFDLKTSNFQQLKI